MEISQPQRREEEMVGGVGVERKGFLAGERRRGIRQTEGGRYT